MSNNIIPDVKIKVSDGTELIGRLIGFINNDECKAILNSKDAPKKISTSEATSVNDHVGNMTSNRFVLVTKESPEDGLPTVFISPKVNTVSWLGGNVRLHCKDRKTYTFEGEFIG